jgi:hypothetical protein
MGAPKYQQVTDNVRGITYLRSVLSKGHILDFSVAQRIYRGSVPGLLPFSLSEEGKKPELYYFIDEMASLKRVLDAGIGFAQMRVLLMNLIATLETCQSQGLVFQNMDFDPDHVYVKVEILQPQFIYLPLQNFRPKGRGILELIIHIVSNMRPANAYERAEGFRLLGFIKEQNLFSLIDLKEFLKDESETLALPVEQTRIVTQPVVSPRAVRDFVQEARDAQDVSDAQEAPNTRHTSPDDAGR